MASDRLKSIWGLQAAQQSELGLDPGTMSDLEKARCSSDLTALLHEEAAELGRLHPTYKRHLLDFPKPELSNVADGVADVLKTVFAIAQLHGLGDGDLVEAFNRKTQEVSAKAASARLQLRRDTKLLCVDLDDVVCDLSEWKERLTDSRGKWINADYPPPDMLAASEALKDEFYRQGRFRTMPIIEGAPEALRELKADGFKIVIVSARPHWQYKRLHADTLWWLEHHGIPHDLILFNKDKVEAIHGQVAPAWPVAFVEDHERNIKALAAVGVDVLVFDQPYNRHISDGQHTTRVYSWADVMKLVRRLWNTRT